MPQVPRSRRQVDAGQLPGVPTVSDSATAPPTGERLRRETGQLRNTLGDFAFRQANRADDIKVNEQINQYERELGEALINESENVLGDAAGSANRMEAKELEIRNRILGGLVNGNQKIKFNDYASKRSVEVANRTLANERKQILAHDNKELEARIETAHNTIMPEQMVFNPEAGNEKMNRELIVPIMEWAERNDIGPEALEQRLARDRSRYHRGSIELLMSQEDDMTASAYFSAYKDEMTKQDQGAMLQLVGDGSTEGAARRFARDLIIEMDAREGGEAQAIRMARDPNWNGSDSLPEGVDKSRYEDALVRHIRTLYGERKDAEIQSEDKRRKDATNAVMSSRDPSLSSKDLVGPAQWNLLTNEDKDKLEEIRVNWLANKRTRAGELAYERYMADLGTEGGIKRFINKDFEDDPDLRGYPDLLMRLNSLKSSLAIDMAGSPVVPGRGGGNRAVTSGGSGLSAGNQKVVDFEGSFDDIAKGWASHYGFSESSNVFKKKSVAKGAADTNEYEEFKRLLRRELWRWQEQHPGAPVTAKVISDEAESLGELLSGDPDKGLGTWPFSDDQFKSEFEQKEHEREEALAKSLETRTRYPFAWAEADARLRRKNKTADDHPELMPALVDTINAERVAEALEALDEETITLEEAEGILSALNELSPKHQERLQEEWNEVFNPFSPRWAKFKTTSVEEFQEEQIRTALGHFDTEADLLRALRERKNLGALSQHEEKLLEQLEVKDSQEFAPLEAIEDPETFFIKNTTKRERDFIVREYQNKSLGDSVTIRGWTFDSFQVYNAIRMSIYTPKQRESVRFTRIPQWRFDMEQENKARGR
jgi:hypothetical protein